MGFTTPGGTPGTSTPQRARLAPGASRAHVCGAGLLSTPSSLRWAVPHPRVHSSGTRTVSHHYAFVLVSPGCCNKNTIGLRVSTMNICSSRCCRLEVRDRAPAWSGSGDGPPPGLWTAVSLGVSSGDRTRGKKLQSLFLPTRALTPARALHPHDPPETPPPTTITGVKISTRQSGVTQKCGSYQ